MTVTRDTPPSADGLAAAAAQAGAKGPPPVHLWNPPFCGDLDIEIRADGSWFYLGTPIGREALVRLFASILKVEDGRFYLVTPVEKVGIRVADAPFIAVDMTAEGDGLAFVTNVGDRVIAGPDHAIRVDEDAETGTPRPYIHIRRGLWARIDRKTFYRLAEIALPRDGRMWVTSGGADFDIGPGA
ncbi:DUF1285 domain-containing protein [Paracoccus sp. p3-h83]|uniref:DUF1285 domain-containing protein n=1 Tax=Paracoccus sp. p3-h83 TaxID=3342805 RepID=UPI0035B70AF3